MYIYFYIQQTRPLLKHSAEKTALQLVINYDVTRSTRGAPIGYCCHGDVSVRVAEHYTGDNPRERYRTKISQRVSNLIEIQK